MKRNKTTSRVTRRASRVKGKSRYMAKVMSGKQMYGPGCCAHTRTRAQIEAGKEAARARGHFAGMAYYPPVMEGDFDL